MCTDFYSRAFGTASVLDAVRKARPAGWMTSLARASRANQGEDFSVALVGTVRDFVRAGLVPGGLDALYGSLSAYEIQYAPGASPTTLCLAVAATPAAGTRVTLQRCGMNARTIWIFDPESTSTGPYDALISAATSRNFQHPEALTALVPGFPLVTIPLADGLPASVLAHQLWSAEQGALPAH